MTPIRNTDPAVSFVDAGYIKLRQPLQHPPCQWKTPQVRQVGPLRGSSCTQIRSLRLRVPSALRPSSTPPRPSLLPLPWRTPSVCLRFNSPFQLGHRGRQPTKARCLPRPEFGHPLAGPKHPPLRTQAAMQFPVAKAMPAFQSAASYAAYPKASASAVQASITTPTPSPLQEKPPPPAQQAASAPRKLQPPPSGLTTSRDMHHVADAKNSALFAELCERHATFSEVLQQLRGSHHGASIKARLLSKVSDTTAARYLRSVQLFFSAFEELGGQPTSIKASFWTRFSHCPAALRMAHFPTPRMSSRPSAGTRSCWGFLACRIFTDRPSRFSVQQRSKKNGRVYPSRFVFLLSWSEPCFPGPPAWRSAPGQDPS